MGLVDEIPPNVRRSVFVRLERVKDEQRAKRQFIKCYGLERGLYEYTCAWTPGHRNCIASDWRYVREVLAKQGYETRVVVKILKQEGSGL